ncbi:MAG: hypothetical protein ACREIA_23680 [Opitutaceae bacterium]
MVGRVCRYFKLRGLAMPCLVASGLVASAAARELEPENATVPRLVLDIRDEGDGRWTPARFSLLVDGKEYYPDELNTNGLLFTSVHKSRQQLQTITYARGTGPVELALPKETRRVEVRVAKGVEYFPVTVTRDVTSPVTSVAASLERWANLGADGWFAADEHAHYDRLAPEANRDWFTMLAADDLSHVHFMMAKGGQVPGKVDSMVSPMARRWVGRPPRSSTPCSARSIFSRSPIRPYTRPSFGII